MKKLDTLVEVKERFFWHDRTKSVKKFSRICEKCQLTKQSKNMKSSIEKMKSILICDLFFHVAMDTTMPYQK
jgi:hypothetical protein